MRNIIFLLVLPFFMQAQNDDCYRPQITIVYNGENTCIFAATLEIAAYGLPKYAQIEFVGDCSECYVLGSRIMIEPTPMGYFIPARKETPYWCKIGRPEELNLPVIKRIKYD